MTEENTTQGAVLDPAAAGPATAPPPYPNPPRPSADAPLPKAELPFPEEASVNELQSRPIGALQILAGELGWRINGSRGKHQLVYEIISWMSQHGTRVTADGFLEVLPEGYGLLRYPQYSFTPLPEDIFVPPFVMKKFMLRPGQKLKVVPVF